MALKLEIEEQRPDIYWNCECQSKFVHCAAGGHIYCGECGAEAEDNISRDDVFSMPENLCICLVAFQAGMRYQNATKGL